MKMDLKNVHCVRSKGKTYYYHRPTKTRLRAPYGTAAFVAELERVNKKLDEADDAPSAGTLGALIRKYRESVEWSRLAPASKADYQDVFDYLQKLDGMPLALIDGPCVIDLRDKAFKKHKRRFANYVVQVLSLIYNWGKPRGITTLNPAEKVPKIKKGRDEAEANRPWTLGEFRIVMMAMPEELATAVALGGYIGMREEDVVVTPFAGYDGTAIQTRQLKTGEPIWVPAHKDLRTILDAERRRRGIGAQARGATIVVGARGHPFTVSGFRSRFFKVIRELVEEEWVEPGLTFHGLRHTAANFLHEAGCDTVDIQAVLGHKHLRTTEHYTRRANRRRRAATAIGRLEEVEILPSAQVLAISRTPSPAPQKVKVAPMPPTPKRGEEHGQSKLTEAQVQEILESTDSQRTLAARYGVSRSLIEQVKNGKVWRHLYDRWREQSGQRTPAERPTVNRCKTSF